MKERGTGQRVGYIRVSTFDQNPERQLDGIELEHKFIDRASGKDVKRPELEALLRFVRSNDTVVVHSMDRLARNLGDLRSIVNSLTAKNIDVEFIKERLTFTGEDSPMANFMLSVMGGFAEFERALSKERQREGIELAKKRGAYRGRKKALSDSDIIKLQHRIQNRISSGSTKTQIAKEFGISRETLYQYCKESDSGLAERTA